MAQARAGHPIRVVHSRRRYWLGRGLAAVVFAIACGAAMRTGSAPMLVFGAIGLVLFAAFAAYALRQLMRRGPRLVLGVDGVDAADLGVGTIPWTDLVEVAPFGSNEAPFLALQAEDPARWLAAMPGWPARVQRLLERQGLPLFSVNLIGVDADPWEIADEARQLWERQLVQDP